MPRTPKHYWLIKLLLVASFFAGCAQAPVTVAAAQTLPSLPTTQLTDTVYRADGSTATGTVLVSWPAFTTSAGLSVPAGNTSVAIASGGVFTVTLVPNAGSNPMGSYYTAVYHLDDGAVSREYWVVPVSSTPVTIATIKSTVLPASVALQTVSKSYVDTAIAAAVTGSTPTGTTAYVPIAGGAMTGPLLLPADPVSSLQASDKHYVDISVASVSGGVGGVALHPAASQVITQPAATSLSVNRLNGAEYASQYATSGLANGVANATASPDCSVGCEVKVDPSYAANEVLRPIQWPSQTHVEDMRKGGRWDSYINPENYQSPGLEYGQAIDVVSTRSGAQLFQLNGTQSPTSAALLVSDKAPTGGSNLFPQSIDTTVPYFKSGYSALVVSGNYNTQGQHVLVPRKAACYGVGDCLIGSEFLVSSGGFRDEADEGTHPQDVQVMEDTLVFDGTCATGCTTGSTTVNVTPVAGTGTQGDGRFLIDMNPSKVLSSGTLAGGVVATPHASASFSGTAFPLSTFFSTGQAIVSQANDVAPGTVTFAIATSGAPSGYATSTASAPATSGLACIADQVSGVLPSNYEMATYIVTDAAHLRITFKKAHAAQATVAIGGLCGYGLEQTVDTTAGIRQVFPVVGSFSATGLYYAGTTSAVIGQTNTTSAYLNANVAIANLTRFGNLVTLTTTSNLPLDLNGLPVTISGVGDSSYNGTFTVTSIAANSLTYNQSGANSTSTGGNVAVVTGGFALYPMAEVLSVYNASTKAVDGQMTLAPNNVAWAAGDSVEEPHFFQQQLAADISYVTQTTPRPTTLTRAGVTYQGNNGPGLQGWTINNNTPASNYIGNGGTHNAPDAAYEATGVWKRTMVLQGGETSLFDVNCNSHGCAKWNSPFNLFELQSSVGTDTMQWAPQSSSFTMSLRGTGFSFAPSGFTATNINVTNLNATNVSGLSAASIGSGTFAPARLPLFGASGVNHAVGAVPDPGATAGVTRYLREDGSWSVPAGTGGGGGGGSSSVAAITSGTIDGTTVGASAPSTGAFTTLTAATPVAPASGGTGSSTAPTAGQMLVGNSGGTAFAPQTVSGDCTMAPSGALTCLKVNGTNLGAAATHGPSISINGTACSLDGSCNAFSFATLPQQASVLADYQLNDGSGNAPADSSPNGNTGSFPNSPAAPTWTSQGLACSGTAGAGGTTGQYFTTAGTQNAKTIMMVYTLAAPGGSNGPANPAFYTLWANSSIAGLSFNSGSQNYGYQPYLSVNGGQQSTMDGSMVGTHVLIVVLGVSGGSPTQDTYYLDGVQQPTVAGSATTFGKANGVYNVCGSPTGFDTYMTGNVYRWTAWSTQLTAQDAAAATGLTKTLAQSKGVSFAPFYTPTVTPQLVCTGDSLTNGNGVTPFCTSGNLSTSIGYNVVNYGIGNIGSNVNMSLLPSREKVAYAPNAKSNVSFIWNGTNDIVTKGRTAQQTVDAILQECSIMHSFGFRTIAATIISRGTSGTSNDTADKDAVNPLLRAQALNSCDALADFAGNPLMGADGAYSNTTYYQGDTTHLTATGQASVIAPMASHAIDQVTGSTLLNCDPNVVTAATYTSVAGDGCKVFNTAGNAITDTLPSAVGYTNRVIRRCNNSLSGSNTLTLGAPADSPFNNIAGTTAITVANNSCKDFKGTLISNTAAGEYWQQLN
jgi:hypothetical protein